MEITNSEPGEALEEEYKDHLCSRCGDPCDCDFHLDKCGRCLRCQDELLETPEGG